MWHASARATTQQKARELAVGALRGVGDAALGEWFEIATAVHVRRRLSASEAQGFTLRDIRGTPEEAARRAALLADAPHLAQWLVRTP